MYMAFNDNRCRYHCGLMMNHLQPSGYWTCRQGQYLPLCSWNITFFFLYVALNLQQIYFYTAFINCVPNGGTLYSRWGNQRFYYRSQTPEDSAHSNALVTHSIPFPNHAVPLKVSNVSFLFDLYFSTRGVWNKNGEVKALRQASESVTVSYRLDWKRQQEFYFS